MVVERDGVGGWGMRRRMRRRRKNCALFFSSALQRAVAEAATEIRRS